MNLLLFMWIDGIFRPRLSVENVQNVLTKLQVTHTNPKEADFPASPFPYKSPHFPDVSINIHGFLPGVWHVFSPFSEVFPRFFLVFPRFSHIFLHFPKLFPQFSAFSQVPGALRPGFPPGPPRWSSSSWTTRWTTTQRTSSVVPRRSCSSKCWAEATYVARWGGFCCFNWLVYPLVMTNIAMENCHRNSGFSHRTWWFSIAIEEDFVWLVMGAALGITHQRKTGGRYHQKNTKHTPWRCFNWLV